MTKKASPKVLQLEWGNTFGGPKRCADFRVKAG